MDSEHSIVPASDVSVAGDRMKEDASKDCRPEEALSGGGGERQEDGAAQEMADEPRRLRPSPPRSPALRTLWMGDPFASAPPLPWSDRAEDDLVDAWPKGYRIEVPDHAKMYRSCCRVIARDPSVRSLVIDDSPKSDGSAAFDERKQIALGLGSHDLSHEGRPIRVFHHAIGKPSGGATCPRMMRSLVMSASERETLLSFCRHVMHQEHRSKPHRTQVLHYNVSLSRWISVATIPNRSLSTVVLDREIKDRVVQEVRQFEDAATKRWYDDHGIAYRRTFLLHGPPGTGKTSFIRALACKFGRALYYLQPTQLGLDDAALCGAVQKLGKRAILVLEDVDALFGRERESSEKTRVTFSGMLNALDGICGAYKGLLVFMTTNHPERLDAALLRPGRVDLRIALGHATLRQTVDLFRSFYPQADACLAARFRKALCERFGLPEEDLDEGDGGREIVAPDEAAHRQRGPDEPSRVVSPQRSTRARCCKQQQLPYTIAVLQQHFIACRTKSAGEAIEALAAFSVDGTHGNIRDTTSPSYFC